jgi:hypothetical protein
MVPPMGVIAYALLQCVAPDGVLDPLPGIPEGSPSVYDSIGGSAGIQLIWPVPILLLLRASRHHFLGPL